MLSKMYCRRLEHEQWLTTEVLTPSHCYQLKEVGVILIGNCALYVKQLKKKSLCVKVVNKVSIKSKRLVIYD